MGRTIRRSMKSKHKPYSKRRYKRSKNTRRVKRRVKSTRRVKRRVKHTRRVKRRVMTKRRIKNGGGIEQVATVGVGMGEMAKALKAEALVKANAAATWAKGDGMDQAKALKAQAQQAQVKAKKVARQAQVKAKEVARQAKVKTATALTGMAKTLQPASEPPASEPPASDPPASEPPASEPAQVVESPPVKSDGKGPFCAKCGRPTSEGDKYCTNCGAMKTPP
jgi:hypothetical protein